jgi:hypothetical protein
MYRDHVTLEPMTYYSKFPDNLPDAMIMVLDPMLATDYLEPNDYVPIAICLMSILYKHY